MTTALSLQMLEAAVEQCYDAILVTGAELDAPGPGSSTPTRRSAG